MDIKNNKYRDIFNNFKRYNTPLPLIQLKINQQKKIIENVLKEMDKNYKSIKNQKKNKQKSEKKTRNRMSVFTEPNTKSNNNNKHDKHRDNKHLDIYDDKIDFGADTYLTYKLNNDECINLCKSNIELLRQKVINSNNFRMGYLNAKTKFNDSYKNKDINLTEVKKNKNKNKNKNRMSIDINRFIDDKKKNRHVIKIYNSNLNKYDKSENKNDCDNNDNYNLFDTDFSTNRNFKSTKEVIRKISPFVENIKKKEKSNSNLETNIHFTNRSYTNLKNKKSNFTNYSRNHNNNYNNNNNIKYNITNYMDTKKPKPIDIKINTIMDNNKTSINFKDNKNLFINNTETNKNNNNNTSNNNIQLKPLSKLTEEIYDINDKTKLNQKKLNHISKKRINIKHIEKLIRKNVVSNSVIGLLMGGRKHKVKLRANINKIKKQMKHLSVVDKIEKYSDNIPSEKMVTFNQEYYRKSERIGISNRCITFKNGKIYQQSKSDSKKLSKKISQNCDEMNKLADQILIDKYYFDKKSRKCQRILETIRYEKIDLSFNKNI